MKKVCILSVFIIVGLISVGLLVNAKNIDIDAEFSSSLSSDESQANIVMNIKVQPGIEILKVIDPNGAEYEKQNQISFIANENKVYAFNIVFQDESKVIQEESFACSIDNIKSRKARAGEIIIDSTTFPDQNLRDYILTFFPLGYITSDDIASTTQIDCSNMNIADIKGLEYFTELITLDCSNNVLTTLTLLDSQFTKLQELNCSSNQLTTLAIASSTTPNSSLTKINASGNLLSTYNFYTTALLNIDLSDNKLTSLSKTYSTNLTNANYSKNLLTKLPGVGSSEGGTGLDNALADEHIKIKELNFSSNKLTVTFVIGISSLYPELEIFNCSSNTIMGLHNLPSTLIDLNCANVKLTMLDISKAVNLKVLRCHINRLTSLDISKNTKLVSLYANENQIVELNTSSNPVLGHVFINNNNIASFDLRNNPKLSRLVCWSNKLTSLDVSNNTLLTELDCGSNALLNIDVTKHPKLTVLAMYNTGLLSIDVSNNPELTRIDVRLNTNINEIDVSHNNKLKELWIDSTNIKTLDVSSNTELIQLWMNSTAIEHVDVSKNLKLQSFQNENGVIKNIDVSKNPLLIEIKVFGTTGLTNIDLSKQKSLETVVLSPQGSSTTTLKKYGGVWKTQKKAFSNDITFNNANIKHIGEGQIEIKDADFADKMTTGFNSNITDGSSKKYQLNGDVRLDAGAEITMSTRSGIVYAAQAKSMTDTNSIKDLGFLSLSDVDGMDDIQVSVLDNKFDDFKSGKSGKYTVSYDFNGLIQTTEIYIVNDKGNISNDKTTALEATGFKVGISKVLDGGYSDNDIVSMAAPKYIDVSTGVDTDLSKFTIDNSELEKLKTPGTVELNYLHLDTGQYVKSDVIVIDDRPEALVYIPSVITMNKEDNKGTYEAISDDIKVSVDSSVDSTFIDKDINVYTDSYIKLVNKVDSSLGYRAYVFNSLGEQYKDNTKELTVLNPITKTEDTFHLKIFKENKSVPTGIYQGTLMFKIQYGG